MNEQIKKAYFDGLTVKIIGETLLTADLETTLIGTINRVDRSDNNIFFLETMEGDEHMIHADDVKELIIM